MAAVFISHSSKDQRIAMALCEALEERGLQCWISGRDVGPGENFQEAIVRAIRNARVMVLVFTANANNSDEIKKELVLANQGKLAVIPVRVEDVIPNEALSYEFATRQWIDLFDDWEKAVSRLHARVRDITGNPEIADTVTSTPATRYVTLGAFGEARRRVPAVDFSIGVSVVALIGAAVLAVAGNSRAALAMLAAMLVALIFVVLASHFFLRGVARHRRTGAIVIWSVSIAFLVFMTLAATAFAFRWPEVLAMALGVEDGITCSRLSEPTTAFVCQTNDEGHAVVNIRLDDSDGGLVVRAGPSVESIQRGVIPPNGRGIVIEGCDGDWCRVRCDARNLRGHSRKRYLVNQSEATYAVVGSDAASAKGLIVRTGPHLSCRTVGTLPYQSRDVTLHHCQGSPLERSANWCRISFGSLSGWIAYGFLDRQK